jgi:hypothetical protein
MNAKRQFLVAAISVITLSLFAYMGAKTDEIRGGLAVWTAISSAGTAMALIFVTKN